jgi:hypothetical protein
VYRHADGACVKHCRPCPKQATPGLPRASPRTPLASIQGPSGPRCTAARDVSSLLRPEALTAGAMCVCASTERGQRQPSGAKTGAAPSIAAGSGGKLRGGARRCACKGRGIGGAHTPRLPPMAGGRRPGRAHSGRARFVHGARAGGRVGGGNRVHWRRAGGAPPSWVGGSAAEPTGAACPGRAGGATRRGFRVRAPAGGTLPRRYEHGGGVKGSAHGQGASPGVVGEEWSPLALCKMPKAGKRPRT